MSGEWLLAWDDDRTTAQAITDQLLHGDPIIARAVYNALHSHYVAQAARDKRRGKHHHP